MINKGMNKMGKQKGLTLIESLVVVGILLGIVAVALTLFGTVRDRLNVKNESENASFVYSQIVDLYSDEATANLDTETAIQAGVVPKKMNVVNGKITDAWGGKVEIEGSGTSAFQLSYSRVPTGDVCVNFVKNQKKVGWDSVDIGSGGGAYSEIRNADIAKDCESADDYIMITFKRDEDT